MRSPRLTEFMSKMEPNSVAVIFSAPEVLRNADTDYEFRQDSDFYALTHLNEPESVAVISPNHEKHKYVLFVRQRDKEKEIWNGLRAGVEGAISAYGADAAYEISQLGKILPRYLEGNQKLYYRFGLREENDLRMIKYLNSLKAAIRAGKQTPSTIIDPSTLIHELRLRKNADEIESMRTAARISAEGHVAAMKACKPGMYEYELEALIEYVFRSKGANGTSYQSIVGAGFNSTILHYNTNNAQIKDGDLVLIDAGAEYNMFAGDITRTFPANGKYSKAQQAVYELVLHSNKEVIKMIKPGESFMALHEKTIEIITQGLVDLGLLSGNVSENIERKTYERFFMHRTGHWLGMDVHDVGRYKLEDGWRKIEPGMAFTVEPGIYIQPGTEGASEEFYNIGIRVEDDIVVTADGCEVLTSLVPKEVVEVEALMKESIAIAV
ncbi:MAG: aminopeptidase P N-terminal domain-containing protein [Acidobacteria bacterium]|nr:aminopeptidase P N-terminal domain-containing protein [Acidobacteriota bacterium]